MGRPKGSKNKPKPTLGEFTEMIWEKQWQDQKESSQPTAAIVEKQVKPVRAKKTTTTTIQPDVKECSLSGTESAPTAITPMVVESGSKQLRLIKGYVNIQRNTMSKKMSYYTGGDIHDSIELAKAHASKNTVATVYLAFEVKE